MVVPLQDGNRLKNGVRVAVRFLLRQPRQLLCLTATATWHNLDTGASGGKDITVASTANPASGGRPGNVSCNRVVG
jgi:hypothetical protein